MPIHCPIHIRDLSKPEFDVIDKIVMRCSYATQNTLGRLCDERVYENDVALRLRAEGFREGHTQVPITVMHESFKKTYRLDLVADQSLYDVKTVEALVGKHEAQVIHYAMLINVGHGKLLNFRPPRVEGRLKFNALSTRDRYQLEFDMSRWQTLSEGCEDLQCRAREILDDWGSHLDVHLYEEALLHFCGRERRVPVVRAGHKLGTHRIYAHADQMLFVVTTMTDEIDQHEEHLCKLLHFINFKAIQWINLNHSKVQFITLTP